MSTDLDALAATVADGTAPRDARVAALRELVKHADKAASLAKLRALLAAPGCAELLAMMVRSLGYYPGTADDLAPFLVHGDMEVARSAVRALAALDVPTAVRLAGARLKKSPSRTGAVLARALAERCPGEALTLFAELAQATRARQRMVALVFLRKLDPIAALPVLLDMFRRETKPNVQRVVLALIARGVRKGGRGLVEAAQMELTSRAGELAKVLAGKGPKSEHLETSHEVLIPVSRELDIPDDVRAAVAQAIHPPPETPPPPPAPRPSAPIPVPSAARPSRPTPELRPSRPVPAPASAASFPAWAYLAGSVAALALVVGIFFSAGQSSAVGGGPPPVAEAAQKLGRIGTPVELAGEVTSFDAGRQVVMLQLAGGVSAQVGLPQGCKTTFTPGQRVNAMGVIRYLGPGAQVRVQGFRVVETNFPAR